MTSTSNTMLGTSLPDFLLVNLIFKSFWIEVRFITTSILPVSSSTTVASFSISSSSAAYTLEAWASAMAISPSSPIT